MPSITPIEEGENRARINEAVRVHRVAAASAALTHGPVSLDRAARSLMFQQRPWPRRAIYPAAQIPLPPRRRRRCARQRPRFSRAARKRSALRGGRPLPAVVSCEAKGASCTLPIWALHHSVAQRPLESIDKSPQRNSGGSPLIAA